MKASYKSFLPSLKAPLEVAAMYTALGERGGGEGMIHLHKQPQLAQLGNQLTCDCPEVDKAVREAFRQFSKLSLFPWQAAAFGQATTESEL